jgi:hypothetical protein
MVKRTPIESQKNARLRAGGFQMKHTLWERCKRIAALVLAAVMLLSAAPVTVFAEDGEAAQAVYPILLNGRNTADAANRVSVTYGDALALSLDGYTAPGASAFIWLPGSENPTDLTATWTVWSENAPAEPGTYYLGYSFSDSEGKTLSRTDGSCTFTITRAQLAAPAGAAWTDGSTASWSPVTLNTAGGALAAGAVSGYAVTLYKDGALVQTAAADQTSFDFEQIIRAAGAGLYTFTVQAQTSDAAHYENSGASALSGSEAAVQVTVSAGTGIASVTPKTTELLLAGKTGANTLNISAAAETGRSFSGWTAAPSAGVSIDKAAEASATITVGADFAASGLTVTANSADTTAPTITSYAASAGSLTGAASDVGGVLAKYAFSTAETAAEVTGWLSAGDQKSVSETYAVAAAGTYYFYAQDASGNTARSAAGIQATAVVYSGYYENGAAASRTDYLVGDGTLTLAVPLRPGYAFGGWHLQENCEDASVAQIGTHSETAVEVYAKWTREPVNITGQPEGYTGEYDGAAHELRAAVGNTAGTVCYQWYRDNTAVAGATESVLRVKNVSDSGSYTVVVTITIGGEAVTAASSPAAVSITKKPLKLTADSKTAVFGDAVPVYTLAADGFVSGEGEDVLRGGSIRCGYAAGSDAGSYPITPEGYEADNYSITCESGVLTVGPKNGATGEGMSAALEQSGLTYTGSAAEPAVTVKDGEKTLVRGTDYTVAYQNNLNAGRAAVQITFRGNYTGSEELTFTIAKASFAAETNLTGWTYGDTAGTPSVSTNPGSGAVTYYYRAAGSEAGTATQAQPTAAGDYLVFAAVAETANYQAFTTPDKAFAIAKRVVRITAASGSWVYDGSTHTNPGYTREGGFAGSDGFRSVTVTGSVTDVGTQLNTIAYTLSSVTDPGNYDILAENGHLTVTQLQLTAPAGAAWDGTAPGTAGWVAVSREGLTVSYEAELRRVDANGESLVKTVSTSETYHDFAADIRADSLANGAAGYCVRVRAVPADKSNYSESDYSDYSAILYTVALSVTRAEGVSWVKINGTEAAKTTILLQNETVSLSTVQEPGYVFSGKIWSEASGVLSFADAAKPDTTAAVSGKLTEAMTIAVAAACSDALPVISAFSAETYDSGSKVRFTFSATDSRAITGWAITTSAEVQPAQWNAVNTASLAGQTLEGVTATGSYCVWVKDNGGNAVCSASNASGAAGLGIYRLQFAAGEGGSGAMASIFKVEDTALTLPDCAFTRSGYSFRNWQGATGLYANGSSYAANQSDTLTVQWTDQQFAYTVNYYEMDTAGHYPVEPTASARFSGAYGATVRADDAAVALVTEGMQRDTDIQDNPDSIELTQDGLVLNIYYKRLSYTLRYSWTLPDGTAETADEAYLCGAAVTERARPEAAGYAFVGWIYESGGRPETMPAENLTATGSFAASDASYVIHCYEQNLPEGTGEASYTLADGLDRTVNAVQGQTVTFGTADARSIPGFTAGCVTVSAGGAGGSTPLGEGKSAAGTVSNQEGKQLHINVYYTRNSYALTLNVYDSNLRTNCIYTHTETKRYGETIDPEAFAVWDKSSWTGMRTGTVLASYADWSTGTAPAAMPDGDVTVARDYIAAVEAPYQVEVYYENAEAGTYSLEASLTYYGYAGTTTGAGGDAARPDGLESYINYNTDLAASVPGFDHYEFSANNANNVLTAEVRADGTAALRLYFERKTVTATVTYYYKSDAGTNAAVLATAEKSGKWGTAYDCDALAHFDETVPGGSETFRAGGYTVSYAGYYNTDGENRWPSRKYTAASMLTDNAHDSITLGQSGNTMSVYYIKTDPQTHYTVDVAYNPAGLAKGVSGNVPLTVTVEGKSYKVRVANKADVFASTWVPAAADSAYPALSATGSYTYPGGLRSGFTAVTVGAGTYYLNSAEPDYIYVIDAENQFYYGNRVSYNFLADELNPAWLGYDSAESYLQSYKTAHGDSGKPDDYDEKSAGAYLYNGGFSPILYAAGTYTFTFRYADTYTVTYTMNGKSCSDHKYVRNQTVTIGCDNRTAFPDKAGYTLVWYKDLNYTQKAEDFVITGSVYLYGRYEKSVVRYTVRNYYQLAGTGEYVTSKTGLTAKEVSGTAAYTGSDGNSVTVSVTTTEYYQDGALVIAERQLPCLSYSEVSLDCDAYRKDGFVYDEANPGNVIRGYCEDQGITLQSYYSRPACSLTVALHNTKIDTETTRDGRTGQIFSLEKPEKTGYAFIGWTWQIRDSAESEWADWTGAPTADSDGSVSFAMPAGSVRASANWAPASYSSSFVHYFQTAAGVYATSLYAELQKTGGTPAAVTFGGKSYSGTVYPRTADSYAASIGKDGNICWFSSVTTADGGYAADISELIAVTQPVTMTSETKFPVSDKELDLSGMPMFSFACVQDRTDSGIGTAYQDSQVYTYSPEHTISYYYKRASYTLSLSAASADGGVTGVTLGGAGGFYYGASATVRAAVAAGYTFAGWYAASDTEYKTPLSTETAYTFPVTQETALVARSIPTAAAEPSVAVSGQTSYSYGYASSGELKAAVSFPAGTDSANKVVSYQWYEVSGEAETALAGETAATCLFPTGKECGSYTYLCRAKIARSDNGRTAEVSSNEYTVAVVPAGMSVDAGSYDGTYDGKEHGIHLQMKKPSDTGFTIYYADTELTKSNYSTAGSTTAPVYKDVRMTDGGVGSYTVYYYIRCTDGCYDDLPGSQTVTIRPIPVALRATGSYSKTYDGSAAVSGSVTQSGTGKYALSGGIAIIGLLDQDKTLYIADFSADFNSKNVRDAGSVTLSSITVVDRKTGAVNNNYSFRSDYTLTISGYIRPYPLTAVWGETRSFVYSGAEQAPEIRVEDAGIPDQAAAANLTVQGGQTNAGSYTAYAALRAGEGFDTANYTFTNASCAYEITKRPVTVTPAVPAAGTTVYDGEAHPAAGFSIEGLVEGQTYTAGTDAAATAAGSNAIKATGLHILSGGTDVTDNYEVTYGTADYQIAKRTVTVSGFTADSKVYDGNQKAAVHAGGAVFAGLVAGDRLAIADGSITGSFNSAAAGTGKTVTVALEPSDLAGESAANYTLDVSKSDCTARADITRAVLTVTGRSVSTVYGEDAPFGADYSGFVNGETESVLSGTAGYTVRSGGVAAAYAKTTAAGSYDIVLDVSGLSADNYTFRAADTAAKLTVAKRPLAVTPSANPSVVKVYDAAAAANVGTDDWTFASVKGSAASGIANGDAVTLRFAAVYDSKDVSDRRTVTMSGLSIDNGNYELRTSSVALTTGCAITKKALTVTANDQTAVYGSAAPAFTAACTGFAPGESASALGGALAFDCGYDTAAADKRGAGQYDITPKGCTSGNYDITFVKGTLTVAKAVITAAAKAETVTYGLENTVPVYSSTYSGFQYEEDSSVITGTLSTGCAKTYLDVPGTYAGAITPDVSKLSAVNYTFKAAGAALTIVRRDITVSGITVGSRAYDGTTGVAAAQIHTEHAAYSGILEADQAGQGLTVTAAYTSKDVGTDIPVTLNVGLNAYLAARYTLNAASQSSTKADITQRPLTVSVNTPAAILYGGAEPSYTVSYSGFADGENKSVLTGTLAFTESYTAADGSYSPAGSYPITAGGYEQSGNYSITYQPASLTVGRAALAAPAVSWSETAGTAVWTPVSGVGAVAVSGYTVTLVKDGADVAGTTQTVGADILKADYLETMRKNGAGRYQVKVVAVASVTNNENKANAADSAAGVSGNRYAAKIGVRFAADAASQAAQAAMAEGQTAISIANGADYVMIAGESGAAIEAHLKNATGYSVQSLTASSAALSLKAPSADGTTVTSAAALANTLGSAADITVTLALTAAPATLTLALSADPAKATFGYTADAAPKLTAAVGPESGDNLTAAGYTYAYQWYLKEGAAGANTKMPGADQASFSFPTGKSAASDKYWVTCEVTATRTDNGMQKTITSVSQLKSRSYCNVVIERANFSTSVSLAGWTYGQTRNAPQVAENPGGGTVRYEYNTDKTRRPAGRRRSPGTPGRTLCAPTFPRRSTTRSF